MSNPIVYYQCEISMEKTESRNYKDCLILLCERCATTYLIPFSDDMINIMIAALNNFRDTDERKQRYLPENINGFIAYLVRYTKREHR